MQDEVFKVWQNISGSGMLSAIYICAVGYLFFTEKETFKRILLVYLPLLWIAVLFLPVTYRIVTGVVDGEIYYRFFWMLPMTLVTAYTAVQIYHSYRGTHRVWVAVVLAAVIIVGGDFVYDNWRYSKAENPYHVPDTVVQICDMMHAQGREVMALFPEEMMQYVRQYDGTVCMPYGRNILVEDWTIFNTAYDLMEAEVIDCAALAQEAIQYEASYIVLDYEDARLGSLTDFGYVLKGKVDRYEVYYNDEVFQSIYR